MTSADLPRPRDPCDLLVTGGRILDLDSASGVRDGESIAVAGGVIVGLGADAVMEAAWAPTERIDARHHVVSPGFIDAHVHLGAFLGAGRTYQPQAGPGLFSAAGKVELVIPMVAQMCAMAVPDDLVAAVVRPALAAMVRAGFTGVVDAGGPAPGGVAEAAAEVGIGAAIGPSLADQWHDGNGTVVAQADPEARLDAARRFVEVHDQRGDGRVRTVVSAVEPIACSDRLLAGIAELVSAHDLPFHVHSHISPKSVEAHQREFGRTATQRLTEPGLLDQRCTIMHAGSLTDADIEDFAAAGATVNHNPLGNAMLGFGVTAGRSVPRLLAAGVPIVLGSDYAPSSVSNPFELMRAALMLQRDLAGREDALTLEQALVMATHGAAALGRPGEVGRLVVGQRADLVLVDTRGLHHYGTDHPVPALVQHARANDVDTVVVAGEVLVRDGVLTGIDEQAVSDEATRAFAHLAAGPPSP